MKLEIGKVYKTSTGNPVKIISFDKNNLDLVWCHVIMWDIKLPILIEDLLWMKGH